MSDGLFTNSQTPNLLRMYGVAPDALEGVSARHLFPAHQQTTGEIFLRKLFSQGLANLSEPIYTRLTGLLKSIKIRTDNLEPVENEHPLERIIRQCQQPGSGLWNLPPRPLVITHDIDLAACQATIPAVAQVENDLGIRSTWHFLTAGRYRLDRGIVNDLHNAGHDIGFHGIWHDLALGFRPELTQKKVLTDGLIALAEYQPLSFRAPGLAWTPLMATSLAAAGFRADSSLRTYRRGWSIHRPIPIAGGKLWELPLSIQDDHLFRDMRLSERGAHAYLAELLALVASWRAPAVINFHPSALANRLDWYRGILSSAQESGAWELMPVRRIVETLDDTWGRLSEA